MTGLLAGKVIGGPCEGATKIESGPQWDGRVAFKNDRYKYHPGHYEYQRIKGVWAWVWIPDPPKVKPTVALPPPINKTRYRPPIFNYRTDKT